MQRRSFLQSPLAGLAQTATQAPFAPFRDLLAGKEPLTWVFTGDSITHGALHTFGWRSYVEHFAERLRYEMRRAQDIVVNTGISGDTTAGLLRRFDWRVTRFQPRVFSLMMGMNDCATGAKGRVLYRQNLEEIAARARDGGMRLLLHTPNPITPLNAGAARQDLPAYVAILREFAESNRFALVDHYRHWEETRKGPLQDPLYWLNDGSVHPNQFGHIAMAHLLFRELGIFDPDSPTCRLFAP